MNSDSEWEDVSSSGSDSEPEDEYGRHGFCRVSPGYHLGNYKAIKKLGWGNFSTCWLCEDIGGKQVAIKIVKCDPEYKRQTKDEVEIYKYLEEKEGHKNIPKLLDTFKHEGSYGEHPCLVFELFGPNILKQIRKSKYTIEETKKIARCVLNGLSFMHKNGIISTDIKPENILSDNKGGYMIIDLGNACHAEKHFTKNIGTRQYMAPEVIVEATYDTSVDIWAFACVIFECLTGDYLFKPRSHRSYSKTVDHLKFIEELIGRYPKHLLQQGDLYKRYFDKKGQLRDVKPGPLKPMSEILTEKYQFNIKDAKEIENFLLQALNYSTKNRSTAEKMLESDWLKE
jgi:serine/threonine protein kinase